jgi:hypothetical protein
MQRDPITDWQSLTQLYGEMSDGELYELNADILDLTEVAQQVLRDEMKKRGLSQPGMPNMEPRLAASQLDRNAYSPTAEGETEKSDLQHEYTWKTLLCECDEPARAALIREVLREAGIESWIQGPGYSLAPDMSNPLIMVAADQLEQAREIVARPIPQSIIDQFQMQIPEFEPPVCPGCGAEDPLAFGLAHDFKQLARVERQAFFLARARDLRADSDFEVGGAERQRVVVWFE